MSGGLALGYFASGCAPGGGSSNMYSYLLGGDVSLSVTMTLISIIASLGNHPDNLLTIFTSQKHAGAHLLGVNFIYTLSKLQFRTVI